MVSVGLCYAPAMLQISWYGKRSGCATGPVRNSQSFFVPRHCKTSVVCVLIEYNLSASRNTHRITDSTLCCR